MGAPSAADGPVAPGYFFACNANSRSGNLVQESTAESFYTLTTILLQNFTWHFTEIKNDDAASVLESVYLGRSGVVQVPDRNSEAKGCDEVLLLVAKAHSL